MKYIWYSPEKVNILYFFLPSSKIFFTDNTKAILICVISVLCLSCFHVYYLVVSCLERPDLLAFVCNVYLCFCHFPMWYPGSGVVLDCIDSGSLTSFFLGTTK